MNDPMAKSHRFGVTIIVLTQMALQYAIYAWCASLNYPSSTLFLQCILLLPFISMFVCRFITRYTRCSAWFYIGLPLIATYFALLIAINRFGE